MGETTFFTVHDYPIRRLGWADAPAVQDLFERCNDFNQLVTGQDADPNDGGDLLINLPPNTIPEDKVVFGVCAAGPQAAGTRLLGVADVIRGYPAQGIWWIGLLLLDPAARGRGAGKTFFTVVESSAAQAGAKAIRLGVVEQNRAGFGFWQSLGFVEIERRPPVRFGQRDCVVIVMEKAVDRKEAN